MSNYTEYYEKSIATLLNSDKSWLTETSKNVYKFICPSLKLIIVINKLENGNYNITYNNVVHVSDKIEMDMDNVNTHIMFSLAAASASSMLNKNLEVTNPPGPNN